MKVDINSAREICNIVRNNFPYESPWKQYKINYKNLVKENVGLNLATDIVELSKEIDNNKKNLDFLRESYQLYIKKPIQYFEELVKSIHRYKAQNCAETARLGYLVSRINGVKKSDVDLGSLTVQTVYSKEDNEYFLPAIDDILGKMLKIEYGADYSMIDHVVTKINGVNGNTFVVDPLLEEVGNIKDIERIYRKKYGDLFNVQEYEKVKIIDYPSPPYPVVPEISDEEAKVLGKKFPSLVMYENKDAINNVSKHFFSIFK